MKWQVKEQDRGASVDVLVVEPEGFVDGEQDRLVCKLTGVRHDALDEVLVDMQLVAAAPDLLAALEQIARLGSNGEVSAKMQFALVDIARNAVRKASPLVY